MMNNLGAKARGSTFVTLASAIFLMLMLRPYPEIWFGRLGLRAIDAGIALVLALYVALNGRTRGWSALEIAWSSGLLLMAALGFLTMLPLSGASELPSLRDLFEVARYPMYILFLFFGATWASREPNWKQQLALACTIVLTANALLMLGERFFPEQLRFVSSLYSPEHQWKRILSTKRATGLFGNPNTTSLMGSLLLIPVAMRCIASPTGQRRLLGVAAPSALLVWALAGSKTGIFIALATVGFLLVHTYRFRIVVLVPALLGLGAWSLGAGASWVRSLPLHPQTARALDKLLSFNLMGLLSEATLQTRFFSWTELMSYLNAAPWLGNGPLRESLKSSTDNFYLYTLVRYGSLGLGLWLLLWALTFAGSLRKPSEAGIGLCMALLLILAANVSVDAQIIVPVAMFFFTYLGASLQRESAHDRFGSEDPA
jgi:hypothetical protein